MIITQTSAMLAARAANSSSVERQTNPANPATAAKIADTTTISTEARDRLSSETGRAASPNRFRVEGQVYRLEDLAKSQGRPLFAVKMTEDQINESKLHDQQVEARSSINASYAAVHPYKALGQVLVDGKLFATVYDSGAYATPYQMASLSDQDLSPTARLEEIARAAKGEVIYSDLFPDSGGGWAGAPESMLPPVTARSLSEILVQDIAPAMEKQIKAWEEQTGQKYPSRANIPA